MCGCGNGRSGSKAPGTPTIVAAKASTIAEISAESAAAEISVRQSPS
jgi:hypothetical protein